MITKTTDFTKENFIKYLADLGVSPKSYKNYKSDLSHFCGWVVLKVRSFGSYIETLTEAVPFINSKIGYEYKQYLLQNKIPVKTINRRLSTLRHLARYLVSTQAVDVNFMAGIENMGTNRTRANSSKLVSDFQSYLEAERVSKNTVKNYISDVRHFLNWIESSA